MIFFYQMLICLIFFSTFNVSAQSEFNDRSSCSDYDLRIPIGRLNSGVVDIPIRNQGSLGICYAYAAAAMIDVWRFSGSDEEDGREDHNLISSPLFLALQTNSRHDLRGLFDFGRPGEIERGMVCDAINAARRYGGCSYEQLDSNRESWVSMVNRVEQLVTTFQVVWNQGVRTETIQTGEMTIRALLGDTSNPYTQLLRLTAQEVASCINSYMGEGTIRATPMLMWHIIRMGMSDVLRDIANDKCEGHRFRLDDLPNCHAELFRSTTPIENWRKVNLHLGASMGAPIAISFCTSIFARDENLRNPGLRRSNDSRSTIVMNSDCRAHTNVIIGRRYNNQTNKCQILLRNSWGESCDFYPAGNWISCDKGDIWIDAEVISPAMLRIERLENN